jgi:hypothetical protein
MEKNPTSNKTTANFQRLFLTSFQDAPPNYPDTAYTRVGPSEPKNPPRICGLNSPFLPSTLLK